MTEKTEEEAKEIFWRLAKMTAYRTVYVEFGTGEGMIGVGEDDTWVNIAFFDKNGRDRPMEIGANAKAVEEGESPPDETPVAVIRFSNRESLKVLENMVKTAHTYFDKREAGE